MAMLASYLKPGLLAVYDAHSTLRGLPFRLIHCHSSLLKRMRSQSPIPTEFAGWPLSCGSDRPAGERSGRSDRRARRRGSAAIARSRDRLASVWGRLRTPGSPTFYPLYTAQNTCLVHLPVVRIRGTLARRRSYASIASALGLGIIPAPTSKMWQGCPPPFPATRQRFRSDGALADGMTV